MAASKKPDLPPHIEEAVAAIARLHREHQRGATLTERFTDRATATVGRPASVVVIGLFIGSWILAADKILLPWLSLEDPHPYPLLDLVLTTAAIVIAVLILASQRRDDRLALRGRR